MASREPGWELYRTFLAVVEEGSLSGAARRLGLSQPTVGRHVEALEEALCLALFTRSPNGLAPTEAAKDLTPDARAMAHAADAALRRASGEAGKARGVVRITASEIVGAEVLPPILAEFQAEHPGVTLELSLSNRNEDLLRREADIAVRMAAPEQAALVSQKIGEVRLALYAHERHIARHGMPRTVEEAWRQPLIGFARRASVDLERLTGGAALSPDMFAFRTDSDLASFAALKAGLGLGVCQTPLAARVPGLISVPLDVLSFKLGVWVAMHEDLKRVLRMRLLFDHLVAGLRAYLRE